MKSNNFQGIITALSPIHQSGDEKTGASVCLPRQIQYVEDDDEFVELPFISGNSIRGYLRRLTMKDLCDLLDFKFTQMDVFHSFFDGGALQTMGNTQGMLDLELREKLISIPPIHIFGFSIGNQQITSIMQIDQALMCCNENKFRIPEIFHAKCIHDHSQFIDHAFFTRKDESGGSGIQKQTTDQTIQMKVDMETYIPGTMFYHKFSFDDATDLELSCFARMMEIWNERSSIGGKRSTGYGSLKLNYDDIPKTDLYLAYIKNNREKIIKTIEDLQDMFTKNKTPKNPLKRNQKQKLTNQPQ